MYPKKERFSGVEKSSQKKKMRVISTSGTVRGDVSYFAGLPLHLQAPGIASGTTNELPPFGDVLLVAKSSGENALPVVYSEECLSGGAPNRLIPGSSYLSGGSSSPGGSGWGWTGNNNNKDEILNDNLGFLFRIKPEDEIRVRKVATPWMESQGFHGTPFVFCCTSLSGSLLLIWPVSPRNPRV